MLDRQLLIRLGRFVQSNGDHMDTQELFGNLTPEIQAGKPICVGYFGIQKTD